MAAADVGIVDTLLAAGAGVDGTQIHQHSVDAR